MQKITAESPESKSPDLAASNLAQLKALFPELVTESKDGVVVNVDVLKQLVGDKVITDSEEKYGLNWHGKRRARQIALTPSAGTLRPCPAESVDWDTTKNLMIEGDNLEVLKLLQKSYAGKVKLIYIDPPYNTGKDFVYPDNFQDNIKNYLELTGQTGEKGKKLTSNTEASGRFHTDWLNMVYPRLRLARNLLCESGVILVSLDDAEAANMRMVMNDIFGEENFVGVFPWRSRTAKADVPFGVSKDFEWVIAYGKPDFMAGREGERKYYKSDDFEDRWRLSDLTKQTTKDERPNSFFTMINPKNGDKFPANPNRTWSITEETFDEYYQKGKIVFPGDYTFLKIGKPAFRVFESEDKEKAMRKHGTEDVRMSISTYLPEDAVGRTEHGSKAIRELFEEQVFSFPKPVGLIKFFIENATSKDSIIMDFFAGSGTTGHAVMMQNCQDGGKRRYILVQLPEQLDESVNEQKTAALFCKGKKLKPTIAELTKERLRRSSKSLRESAMTAPVDLGFRVFRLDSTNIREWDPNRNNLAASLEESVEHLKKDRSPDDILYELLLKLGLDLCVPIETKKIGKHEVHNIGAGSLLVCLSSSIPQAEVEPLALGIVGWHKELNPAGESTVVFKDSAFADDVAKTNLAAILQQHGIETVRSL